MDHIYHIQEVNQDQYLAQDQVHMVQMARMVHQFIHNDHIRVQEDQEDQEAQDHVDHIQDQ